MIWQLVYTVFFIASFGSANIDWPDTDKTCVAWKTKKKMFLIQKVEPVGINCEVVGSYRALSEGNRGVKFTGARVKVTVPIEKFDSGEKDRDKEVYTILQGKINPKLYFVTNLSCHDIVNWVKGESVDIVGPLNIGESKHEIVFTAKKNEGNVFEASHKTKYSSLGIKPPRVLGGIVAKVYDELELHIRLGQNLSRLLMKLEKNCQKSM